VQLIFDHDQSGRDPWAISGGQSLRRQSAANAGRVSGLSGAGDPQRGRRTGNGLDALGYAAADEKWRPAGHQYPQHSFTALARMVETREPNPETKKKDVVWFALNDDRPLCSFAGVWTEFKGDRGTESKPVPGPHLVSGFLTTSPNAVVEPIHPKAMPVILTTDE
jgi:hypothetical protein